jgi:hypothetical protein
VEITMVRMMMAVLFDHSWRLMSVCLLILIEFGLWCEVKIVDVAGVIFC